MNIKDSEMNKKTNKINAMKSAKTVLLSEYLLGEKILVAPVLTEGAVSRDIYLPSGTWYEEGDTSKVNNKTFFFLLHLYANLFGVGVVSL